MRHFQLTPLALAMSSLLASPLLLADDDTGADKVETIVVTGTRVAGRTISDTAVPVDLVRSDVLERSGTTELNQALSVALPSFNFPRPGLADGTDTIRPATLRGLSPDQSLVLVNSKRRHAAALVNVNGTVGRGASAVDLNTIPMGAISAIEVLRDGASAQYGSDAIAGVMNVRLREASDGGSVTLGYSYRDTSYTTPTSTPPAGATWSAPSDIKRSRSDGETITLSGWKGFELGDNGFLTISAEYKDQERTERGGWDHRQQYPLLSDDSFDPREQTIDRFNAWYGEPELEQWTLFANAGITTEHGKLYGWASYQNRQATSGGFYRRALDDRNVIEIYPDGFLPLISPDVDDFSAAFGYEWDWGEWQLDTSLVYGSNKMAFTIENTLNRSLGPASKTEFDAGGYKYNQWVYNLSGVKAIDVDGLASALNLALGVEARREAYSIFAGEPDSYRNGGVLLPNGNPTASGAQVFPGFRPANEVSESRTAVGAYLDLEANLTDDWLASAAIRAERYSDFGSNLSGKFATRYDFTDRFALRGSVQNGFRAPSLQQQNFTATSTNFVGGIPFDITTFPVNAPVAVAMGAKELDAEKSINFSLGAVMRFDAITITVDAYRIDIDDRIVLSENLLANATAQGQAIREFFDERGFNDIGGGRFFINGVDTETQGLDVVVNWSTMTDNIGNFDFTLVGNYNKTKVTRVPETAELAALDPAPTLFARVNVLTFEKGTPKDKLGAIVNWSHDRFGATLKATRYGEVLNPNANPASDFILSPKVLVDLEGRYQMTDSMRIAFGADNLFDTYPDAFPASLNGTGNTPFSNYSPFGRAGRMLYARISYDF
ncbi:TonB-dependent receptor plug domain-containing protein [Alkalimonas amylolytica]|uniref:Iron complex outermembrane recepter protein n=1 Tax=Alkalimonas amylolytica TaxID=152573 RepID=A0A1H4EHK8_ALKAM|nr:TonB-dependent receptor [Alkalimonas amylolytica]SEA84347.1 iron complex outermembrane recepter protein [Alkalimonas amylolytica]